MPIRLETERLLLREFRAGDLEAYAAMSADAEVMRYIGEGRTLDYGMWALEEKATGTLVGRAGFIDPPGWPGFELLGSTALVYEARR